MTEILAVDPGLTKPGVALMRNNILVKADRLKIPTEWSKLCIVDRCYLVARAAVDWGNKLDMRPDLFICEWPQWYGDNEKGIDPNDLAGLCGISTAVLTLVRSMTLTGSLPLAMSPTPREVWGNVPKTTKGNPWLSPRGQKLKRRLSAIEFACVAKYHDALDAAGLALFAAGRWKQQRLFPGAV